MPFFVAVYQKAWPDHLQQLMAALRTNFATSRTVAPGRQRARVFQRLNEPATLVSINEWASQQAFESHRDAPALTQLLEESGPPPTIEYLQRLHLFVRMNSRVGVMACITVTGPAEVAAPLEAFLRGEMQQTMLGAPGLVSREFFRADPAPPESARFLIVHGWRSIADVEQFRSVHVPRIESFFQDIGAVYDRFTGEVALEYSTLDRAGEV